MIFMVDIDGFLADVEFARQRIIGPANQIPASHGQRLTGADLGRVSTTIPQPHGKRACVVDQQRKPASECIVPPGNETLLSLMGCRWPDPRLNGEALERGKFR